MGCKFYNPLQGTRKTSVLIMIEMGAPLFSNLHGSGRAFQAFGSGSGRQAGYSRSKVGGGVLE